METLIAICIVVVVYFSLKSLFKKRKVKTASNSTTETKKESTFAIQDIPNGYITYKFEDDEEFFVRGVHYKKNAVLEWAKGDNHKLYPRREINNKHDSNAIAIQGESSGKKRKIGYVATEIAEDLEDKGFDKKIKLQLLDVKIADDTDPDSEFDINIIIKYKILIPSK